MATTRGEEEERRLDTAIDEIRAVLRDREERHARELASLKDALFKIETLAGMCADDKTHHAIIDVLKTVLK